LAEKLGLIAEHIATDADVNEGDDFGGKIYKFTSILADKPKCEKCGDAKVKITGIGAFNQKNEICPKCKPEVNNE
jgi:hypothetical protein